MLRHINYLLILCLCLTISGCATPFRRVSSKLRDSEGKRKKSEDIVIKQPVSRLPEYEKLTYRVRWLGLPVGTIIASIKGIKKIRDRDAYLLEVVAKTNNFCSKIYKVDDRFVSYMDTENLCTLRHEVYRREGRYKKDAITDFDQVNHKAYFENFLDKSRKTFDIPEGVQDTLTASYYFRLLPVKVGSKIEYSVCNNESNYQLFCLIQSKAFIRVPQLGEREAFLLQPYAKLEGKKVKKGKATGYFTCDERRLPVFTIIKAPMFTKVTVSLYKIEVK